MPKDVTLRGSISQLPEAATPTSSPHSNSAKRTKRKGRLRKLRQYVPGEIGSPKVASPASERNQESFATPPTKHSFIWSTPVSHSATFQSGKRNRSKRARLANKVTMKLTPEVDSSAGMKWVVNSDGDQSVSVAPQKAIVSKQSTNDERAWKRKTASRSKLRRQYHGRRGDGSAIPALPKML